MSEPVARLAEMLRNRARKRFRHLRKWARREGVTCFRVYDRDIPEIPLAIDWYEGALHIAHYARVARLDPSDGPPAARDDRASEADREAWLQAMAAAAAEALEVAPGEVWIKRHARQRGSRQYGRQGASTPPRVVSEAGLRFEVNLGDYLDTGLFLDHRITRAMIRREAAGARFLNLFCYTGAFTVCAAAGGARETLSVDLSRAYLSWTRRNLALNGFSGPARDAAREPVHDVLRADARELVSAHGARGGFDLAVLDPPTFSNSKKMRGTFDIARDHAGLVNDTLALLRPGGALYFSTNRRRFALDAAAIRAGAIEDITDDTWPPDFQRRPHRAWRITR